MLTSGLHSNPCAQQAGRQAGKEGRREGGRERGREEGRGGREPERERGREGGRLLLQGYQDAEVLREYLWGPKHLKGTKCLPQRLQSLGGLS